MADTPNYCRRLVSRIQPDNTWVEGFCHEKIEKKNALDWCEGCRKRLPLWPKDDATAADAAAEAVRSDDTPELNPNEMGMVQYSKEVA